MKRILYTILATAVVLLGNSFFSNGTLNISVETPTPAVETATTVPTTVVSASLLVPTATDAVYGKPVPADTASTLIDGSNISYSGTSFTISAGLASGVQAAIVPQFDDFSWWPAHTKFVLQNYALQGKTYEAQLLIFPAREYAQMQEYADAYAKLGEPAPIESLQTILNTQSFPSDVPLPFLPYQHSRQVIHAQGKIISFQNGSGIRYVTQYSQAAFPLINNTDIFYTFQGLTSDGEYYVSVIMPVNLPYLAADYGPNAFSNPTEWQNAEKFPEYLRMMVDRLNQGEGTNPYAPSLASMDALVQSLLVGKSATSAVEPAAQPTPTIVTGASCTYGATLVDENPLDGQQFKPGETFKKTWTFKNSGTCTWDASTLMISVANAPGDTWLGGQSPEYRMDIYSNPKKTTVAVGEMVSVVLDMQAPDHGGIFIQNWQIKNSANNQNIPLTYATGATGKNFYVQIVVPGASNNATSGNQIANVKIQQIEMEQSTQACTTSAGYIISAKITGAANAQVSYTISSDNNGSVFAPETGTTIILDNTGGYDLRFGIQGSFSDPGNVKITITVLVNGQAVNYTSNFICQGGVYKSTAGYVPPPAPISTTCSANWFFTFDSKHLPLGYFCPEPAKILEAVGQDFEGGRVYRYAPDPAFPADQRGTIFVIYNDGEWVTFPDLWDVSQPSSDPSIAAPNGRFQPVDSIGKVWRENADVRSRLGWAYEPQSKFLGRMQIYSVQPGMPGGDTHFIFIDHGKWGKVLMLDMVDMGPNKWEIAGSY